MTVLVFGNVDLDSDALPLRILPELRAQCPHATFCIVDPNEEFEVPDHAIILDTVSNIREPRVFTSLDAFAAPPRLSLHDFDLYSHLAFLKKIGRLPSKLNIVGLPPTMSTTDAIAFVTQYITPTAL
jgi:Ni,Fe-hydrogenase maturation factor